MTDAAVVRILIEASLRAIVVAAALAALLAAGRVRSSAFRHVVWSGMVVAMVSMLCLPYVVPPVVWRSRSAIVATVAGVTNVAPTLAAPAAPRARVTDDPRPTASASPRDVTPTLTPSPAPPRWPAIALGLYGMGVIFFLLRWVVGALGVARLRQSERPLAVLGPDVAESKLVTTPITVGVLSPRILLPAGWETWPGVTREAVLAHERAHIARRDPWIRMASYVNRTLFWFHPLAWWLDRTVAMAAEEAADEAGAQAMGGRRAYARLLLDMADTVRRHQGRIAWDGIGVDGGGRLDRRIHRLLKRDAEQPVAPVTRMTIAATAFAGLAIVIACRAAVEPPPLKPDAEVMASVARSQERGQRYARATALTAGDIATLVARVKANPDDTESLETVLMHYAPNHNAPWPADRLERIAARRPLVLLAIERHSEKPLAGEYGALIFPEDTDPLADRDGYAQAKSLWMKHAASPSVTVAQLSNAARFFEAYDPALAETMLLKAQALQPGSVSAQLGRLYGAVVSGSYGATPLNVRRYVDDARARSPLAVAMRAALDRSTDARVLGAACRWLTTTPTAEPTPETRLGRSYCERAVAVAPGDASAVRQLQVLDEQDQHRRIGSYLKGLGASASQADIDARLATVPDTDRVRAALSLAGVAYSFGRDKRERFAIASALATRVLAMPAADDREKAAATFEANAILGAIAILEGRRTEAVRFMGIAGRAPTGEHSMNMRGAVNDLTNYLLKAGERETVAQFFDGLAASGSPIAAEHAEAATKIRSGVMPRQYYYYFRTQLNADGTEKTK